MQRLFTTARWDADLVRDDLRGYVAAALGDPDGVLIGDDTGFEKGGTLFGRGAAAVHGHGGEDHELPARGVPRLRQRRRAGRWSTGSSTCRVPGRATRPRLAAAEVPEGPGSGQSRSSCSR